MVARVAAEQPTQASVPLPRAPAEATAPSPGRRGLRRAILASAIVALLIGWAFPRAGAWLVVEDPFPHAELAVVLSGLPTSRALAARDLYRQGRIDRILVIPEPPHKIEGELVRDDVARELVALGVVEAGRVQWAPRVLLASGVPEERIALLPAAAHGTITEAVRVREFLEDQLPRRLVVITSKSASRRARMLFRHAFRKDRVQVLSCPTPYDPFEAVGWWRQPRHALTVVTEYEKLIANRLTLTIGGADRR